MRRILLAVLAAAMLPATARAGLVLGAGTGVTRYGGAIMQDAPMSDYSDWAIPLHLEAGWKLADRLTLVGFLEMNFGIVGGDFKTTCDLSGDDCLVNQARYGAVARWSFIPGGQLDPFVGVGVASETLALERTSSTSGVTLNYRGTAVELQGGVDYWITDRFSVSPWLGLSFGTYAEEKLVSGFGDWESIPDTRGHTQVTAGVRVGWDFGGGPRSAGPAAIAP